MALTKVTTGGITDATIATADIADDAVTSAKLADDAITSALIADNAVVTAAINADAVTGAKIADDAINSEHYTDGSIDTAHIADNQITLAKMASGTDGQIITYDANGDPVAVGPGTDGQVLTSTGAGSPPAFETLPSSGRAHNLVINGAMNVSQRGTSKDFTAAGYLLDRYLLEFYGGDNATTMAQVDVASGTTPYTLGFRKALKLTNGDQSSGAGVTDTSRICYRFEGQDIAQSGWNYKSSSSYITLSFWVKSSVAQAFKISLVAHDTSARTYTFDTGSLSADTWTKITKTIPGDSTITVDNDNTLGFELRFYQYLGTNYTQASGYPENSWTAYQNPQTPAQTTTWWTTDNATYELTGVQLEVGDSASDFAFESYNETLLKCKRYCHVVAAQEYSPLGIGFQYYSGTIFIPYGPIDMRATPTMVAKSLGSGQYVYEKIFSNSPEYIHQISLDSKTKKDHAMFNMSGDASDAGQAVRCSVHAFSLQNNEPFVYLDAEI